MHYGVTIALWSTTLALGASISDVGVVLAFVGLFCSTSIGFIFPGMICLRVKGYYHLKEQMIKAFKNDIEQDGNMSGNTFVSNFKFRMSAISEFLLPIFMIVFGVVVGIIGTIVIIYEVST